MAIVSESMNEAVPSAFGRDWQLKLAELTRLRFRP